MLAENPLISIITPVFNRADTIHRTIDSVIGQTYTNWEYFLIDDGSIDNAGEVIKNKYGNEPRIHFVTRTKSPKGASTCRNLGAANANGDYLIILDSDDLLESFCLEQRIKFMIQNPDLDFAVFPFKVKMKNSSSYLIRRFEDVKDPLINFLSKESYWQTMCPIWKKTFYFKIEGFNCDFPRYQDVEMHIRALARNDVAYRICSKHDPDCLVVPSDKSDTVNFTLMLYRSLKLLLPQTSRCLADCNRSNLIEHMDSYLKEWMRYFAYTHFNDGVFKNTKDVFKLFKDYRVISAYKMRIYLLITYFFVYFVKLLKRIYLVSLGFKK